MSLKNKLNRMKNHLQTGKQVVGKIKEESIPPASKRESIPNADEWKAYGALPFHFHEEYCLIREVEYPLHYKHGHYTLGELLPVMEKWQKDNIGHPLSAQGHQCKDLFFFDTETTGLSGGAGTTIFLLGYARVHDDKVVVRQHLLPAPGNEVALYQSFLQEVDYSTLVTYNGKAFDWPQVKTRHTLVREHVPKLPSFGHFDLLHAARRLWKDTMESVRLANVEKEILGIKRENDIPGFLAPMIYFDFVKTHEMEGIKGVLKHNEWDVLTLITLYIHLSKILQADSDTRNEKEEFEVGRWFDSLGEKKVAARIYENIVEQSFGASYKLGLIKKREARYDEAKELFLQSFSHSDNPKKEEAAIELSMIFEHKEKDYPAALFYAELAFVSWNEKQLSVRSGQGKNSDKYVKRIERLKRKLKS
ncbi:ribonuclease H-like domain-containing protein [Bacillus tianshenii]|uniref:ribonuclease H-like domain-containing protein n=1 Tax=Sutcliffiella tianshenii TaxID=1463404 RepID=UPI001CD7C656|nr:ribonuclease H-like domain-containing protein [Bacillus tianshenii]